MDPDSFDPAEVQAGHLRGTGLYEWLIDLTSAALSAMRPEGHPKNATDDDRLWATTKLFDLLRVAGCSYASQNVGGRDGTVERVNLMIEKYGLGKPLTYEELEIP